MRPDLLRTTMALLLIAPLTISAQQGDVVFSHQFESGAVSLSPGLVFVQSLETSTGLAGPLLLQLDQPVATDTFVPIVSLAPDQLIVENGGVTVLQGQDSAVVTMTGLINDPTPVLVRASFGNQVYASVRVFNDFDQRRVVSLRPDVLRIGPGGQRTLIATLDLPAKSTGTAIDLSVSPVNAGLFTTPITVAANAFSHSFTYTDNFFGVPATLYASADGTTAAQASFLHSPIGKLVINEVDYDQPIVDAAEFIEVHNNSPDTVPLNDIAVVLINGSNNAEYARFALSDAAPSLAPGGYLVLGSTGLSLPGGVPFIDIGADSVIHNGAPDGIAIIDADASTVIDALSYEGSISAAQIDGFANPVSLVEGTALAAIDDGAGTASLSRLPNGTDNGNANTDFALTATLTPGTSNSAPAPVNHLIINEVDYDQVGTDVNEFIEIYNGTGAPVSLANYRLALINGAAIPASYLVVNLSGAGTLAAGQYLVVRSGTVAVAPGALTINFALPQDNIQNGAPDGIALMDIGTNTVVDALSYEGSISSATIAGFTGTFNLVEGAPFPLADSNASEMSLSRRPNGTDTNDAATDWGLIATMTPGAANPD